MESQPLVCTFCGKPESHVGVLFCFDTPQPPRYLCDDCVMSSAQILLDKFREMSGKVVVFKARDHSREQKQIVRDPSGFPLNSPLFDDESVHRQG